MSSPLFTPVPAIGRVYHFERIARRQDWRVRQYVGWKESEILHRFALQDDKLHQPRVHPVQSTCGGQDDKLAGWPFYKECVSIC